MRRETSQYMENIERSRQVEAIVQRKRKTGRELQEVSVLTTEAMATPQSLPPSPSLSLSFSSLPSFYSSLVPLSFPHSLILPFQHSQRIFKQRRVREKEEVLLAAAEEPRPTISDSLLRKASAPSQAPLLLHSLLQWPLPPLR